MAASPYPAYNCHVSKRRPGKRSATGQGIKRDHHAAVMPDGGFALSDLQLPRLKL
ncbi:MAG: hypothetical protein E7B59_08355 [Enterobacteriaceae bacterium]|nr:hypothetical protein [Enterobacteriaceae bacterium]